MKINKLFWALPFILGMIFVIQQLQHTSDESVNTKQALAMNQQGALLLDVREPDEYSEIHAPNTKLIPLGQLSSHLQEIAAFKDKPIVVMCRSGRRSAKAVALLQEAGYSKAINMRGGMLAWEKDALEVIRKQ